jgi:Uncharacterized lipoprotein
MIARDGTLLVCLAALLGLGGCAGAGGLDVRYPESASNRALLATVTGRRVEIIPVTDSRIDVSRIGIQAAKNENKDVVTLRPVTDVVHDALALELRKNGHVVVAERGDLVLAANVEDFWLDVVRGYATTQYVGKVVVGVVVRDGRTGDPLVSRRYIGIKRRQVDKTSDEAARAVMDAALARAVHDLATDHTLVAAFGGARAAATPR